MIRRIGQLITVCLISLNSKGQDVPAGFELQELIRMAEVYHSTPHLSFDIAIAYSDSATYPAPLETVSGQYKLQEGKFWMMLDSTEMLQGMNYNMVIYHDAKTIVVSKQQPSYFTLLQLPVLDSLFQENQVDSMRVTDINDSTRKFQVDFKIASPYSYYEIIYDPATYRIRSVHYHQPPPDDSVEGFVEITVTFTNYSVVAVSEEYFRESKFIFRDGNSFYVQMAYDTYTVIPNGVL